MNIGVAEELKKSNWTPTAPIESHYLIMRIIPHYLQVNLGDIVGKKQAIQVGK